MNKIIIGFSRPRRFFAPYSWLIRLFDGCVPYSHTYVKVHSDKYDRWLIYQASSLLVNFMGEAIFDAEALTVREFTFTVSDEAATNVMAFAIDHAGEPYDIASVIGLVAVKIAALFGKKIANPLGNRQGGFFCSELAGAIAELLGDHIQGDINTLTPRDMYMAIESYTAAQGAAG